MERLAFRETILCPGEIFLKGEYTLQLAGTTLPDPKYRIARESDNTLYVLEYIVSGNGTLVYGDREYHPSAGDVYLIQPQTEHRYFSDRIHPWEKLWFNVEGPLIDCLCDAYGLKDHIYFPSAGKLKTEFERGLEIVRRADPETGRTELALFFHKIFASLADLKRTTEKGPSPDGKKMREFLQKHWRSRITLSDLEQLTGKSQSQVLRIFRKDWGCAPGTCLQQIRLKNAKLYLENTPEPVKRAAEFCGFRDEFYFSNWFRKHTGIAPAAYRKKHHNI